MQALVVTPTLPPRAGLDVNGVYHALSVVVLGSYIGNFAGEAPKFSLADAKESNPKAATPPYLEQYAKALNPVERDLLGRVSLFPRGVRLDIPGWIVQTRIPSRARSRAIVRVIPTIAAFAAE